MSSSPIQKLDKPEVLFALGDYGQHPVTISGYTDPNGALFSALPPTYEKLVTGIIDYRDTNWREAAHALCGRMAQQIKFASPDLRAAWLQAAQALMEYEATLEYEAARYDDGKSIRVFEMLVDARATDSEVIDPFVHSDGMPRDMRSPTNPDADAPHPVNILFVRNKRPTIFVALEKLPPKLMPLAANILGQIIKMERPLSYVWQVQGTQCGLFKQARAGDITHLRGCDRGFQGHPHVSVPGGARADSARVAPRAPFQPAANDALSALVRIRSTKIHPNQVAELSARFAKLAA